MLNSTTFHIGLPLFVGFFVNKKKRHFSVNTNVGLSSQNFLPKYERESFVLNREVFFEDVITTLQQAG